MPLTPYGTIIVGIKNFRSYLENPDSEDGLFRFRFERGVNLLKGGSGLGKSTVFMAIFWCLFKKPSTGNSPLFKKSGRAETLVTLELGGELKITRKNPGSLLTLTILDDPKTPTLENEEAQNYIYRRFGRENVWKTCNYVQQGTTNPMINGELTDSQRWDVLYGITLDTDPENRVTIDRLKNSLKVKTDTMERSRISAEGELKAVTRIRGEEEERWKTLTTELETIDSTMKQRTGEEIQIIIPMLRKILLVKPKNTEDKKIRERELRVHVGELTELISSLEHAKTDKIRERDSELEIVEGETEQMWNNLGPLRREMDRRNNENQREERLLKIFEGMCGGEDSKLIPFARDLAKGVSFGDFKVKFMKLINGIVWLDSVLNQHTLEELNFSEEVIDRFIMESTRRENPGEKRNISCPLCERQLSIEFHKHTHEIISVTRGDETEIEGREIVNQKSSSYYRKLKTASQKWKTEPEKLRQRILEFLPVAKTIDRRSLSDFALLDPETTSMDPLLIPKDELRIVWRDNIAELQGNMVELENKLERSRSNIRGIKTKYETVVRDLEVRLGDVTREKLSSETKLGILENEMRGEREVERILTDLSRYGISPDFSAIPDMISGLERICRLREDSERISRRISELKTTTESLEGTIKTLLGGVESAARLQEEIERVETDVLSESISRIGGMANEFLENCFDHPILLNLATERETKTGKQKKHSFNISVKTGKREGNLVDRGLEGFSGGETDRISLAFSTAITSFSSFPILMLDECIGSLDSDLKDKTIRALRQQAKKTNKGIILVCHDAVEGLFDHVCDLE